MDSKPQWLRRALSDGSLQEDTYLLGERARIEPALAIRSVQLDAWSEHGLSYEWMGEEALATLTADPELPDRYLFSIDLNSTEGGGRWRLNPLPCYRWQIGGLALNWRGLRGEVRPEVQSMYEESPQVWTALYSDASFSADLEFQQARESRGVWTLSGWIQ